MTQVSDRLSTPAPVAAPAPVAGAASVGASVPPRTQSVQEQCRSLRAAVDAATAESALSDYHAAGVESGTSLRSYALRHPRSAAAALVAIARLPRLSATLADTVGGREVYRTLTRPGPLGTPFGSTGIAVLEVPSDPAEYSLGASKQTVRRKARASLKRGITVRRVTDPAERQALLAMANRQETEHADAQYRNDHPDNSDLLDHDLWLVAYAADGTPLLLSVTPVDGCWAQLRYFRTLGAGPEYSDCRYLVTQVLVETLSGMGARWFFEGTHPAELPNGLRHFQRMVGFRLARVTARRG
jgi:hypothetical protein